MISGVSNNGLKRAMKFCAPLVQLSQFLYPMQTISDKDIGFSRMLSDEMNGV